ncbi:MAG: prepilin peptidase [Oscillospiraceae bacterium]|nr:prepilin peptidase [Oscillospiraceae bacterium]
MWGFTAAFSAYLLFLTALLGLAAGSFINCAAWRLVHHEPFFRGGRSHCVACGHALSPLDLIPLLSWICLRGRCRYCGKPVSARYPLAEAATAVLFLSAALCFGPTLETVQLMLLAVLLMGVCLTDLESCVIYDRFLLLIAALWAAFLPFSPSVQETLVSGIAGAFSVSLPLLLLTLFGEHVLHREMMGGGDIKLFCVLGLFLGWKLSLMTLIFACFTGILFGLVFRNKTFGGGEEPAGAFPFGPAVCLAAWVVLLFGRPLLDWYFSLF